MNENNDRVLITCAAESEAVAWLELKKIFPSLPPADWLDSGDAIQGSIALVNPGLSFEEFADELNRVAPIFIRHIAPVQFEIPLQGTEDDLEAIGASASRFAPLLNRAQTFSVQSRILGDGQLPYRKVVLNETLSTILERQTGAVMDCREPEQIISLLCTPTRAYAGLSNAAQNRSGWPGGKHRFRREEGQISRAEFKLLEAISVFDLALPQSGTALDIGASPGGWTRVLLEHGLTVCAVDPGDLDGRLHGNSRLIHIPQRIQEFLPRAAKYDVIVNDLKMDARASVEIMLQAHGHLNPGGIALMTLKMPRMSPSAKGARNAMAQVCQDLKRLSHMFRICDARQLYHNRSEVTVSLASRGEQGSRLAP